MPPDSLLDQLREVLSEQRPAVLATCIDGPDVGAKVLVAEVGSADDDVETETFATTWADAALQGVVTRDAESTVAIGRTGTRWYGSGAVSTVTTRSSSSRPSPALRS